MADLHSKILNPPISVQFFFIFIQFYGKYGQIIGLRVRLPLWGCPPPRLRTGPGTELHQDRERDREREGRPNPFSGGSRIFLRGGAPTPKILLFCRYFAENCMKMKEFGPPGACVPGAPPFNPPMPFPHCWSRSRSRPLAVWTSYKAWKSVNVTFGNMCKQC